MPTYDYETQKSNKKSGIIWSFIYIHKTDVQIHINSLLCASLPDPILISLGQHITFKDPCSPSVHISERRHGNKL